MIKVITYGTFDLLHFGHVRLLERAKALGDYLIVGVTSDDYDKTRGKINGKQSTMERVEAVRQTGLADEIIVEEYEGQKIDDIKRCGVDIFTVGSDWVGKFDYLNEYCKVIYLDRTKGVSSSDLRSQEMNTCLGLVGETKVLQKYYSESDFVNGVKVTCICSRDREFMKQQLSKEHILTGNFNEMLNNVDAVYIASNPVDHYEHVKSALKSGKHVLCESPIALKVSECNELFDLADKNNLVLMDSIKTAFSTAYNRLLLMLKGGKIGKVISVDTTCTSLQKIDLNDKNMLETYWNSICGWGPTAMLPIFQIFGTDFKKIDLDTILADKNSMYDLFTQGNFEFPNAVASFKVGKGVKSEGEMVISGTKGYIYVPAPWWKTDYFEVRYENQTDNKRFFYQLDGEGIRYELVTFLRAIEQGRVGFKINRNVSLGIVKVIEKFYSGEGLNVIN